VLNFKEAAKKSIRSKADFNFVVGGYTARGINRDLAIRTDTTRLLGSELVRTAGPIPRSRRSLLIWTGRVVP